MLRPSRWKFWEKGSGVSICESTFESVNDLKQITTTGLTSLRYFIFLESLNCIRLRNIHKEVVLPGCSAPEGLVVAVDPCCEPDALRDVQLEQQVALSKGCCLGYPGHFGEHCDRISTPHQEQRPTEKHIV